MLRLVFIFLFTMSVSVNDVAAYSPVIAVVIFIILVSDLKAYLLVILLFLSLLHYRSGMTQHTYQSYYLHYYGHVTTNIITFLTLVDYSLKKLINSRCHCQYVHQNCCHSLSYRTFLILLLLVHFRCRSYISPIVSVITLVLILPFLAIFIIYDSIIIVTVTFT